MNYFKNVIAGIAAALVAAVIFVAALLGIVHWRNEPPPGALVVVVLVSPVQLFLSAVIGFVLGFWWSLRRQRRAMMRASVNATKKPTA